MEEMNDDTLCTISSCMIGLLLFIDDISSIEQQHNNLSQQDSCHPEAEK